jgi:hypothetical protein
MNINRQWHLTHPIPRNPSLAQRIEWHLTHARECGCRPIPPKLLAQMERLSGVVDDVKRAPG